MRGTGVKASSRRDLPPMNTFKKSENPSAASGFPAIRPPFRRLSFLALSLRRAADIAGRLLHLHSACSFSVDSHSRDLYRMNLSLPDFLDFLVVPRSRAVAVSHHHHLRRFSLITVERPPVFRQLSVSGSFVHRRRWPAPHRRSCCLSPLSPGACMFRRTPTRLTR